MTSENALTVFQPKDLAEAFKVADVLSRASILPDALRGKPGDVLAIIIKGQELGLTMMQAIGGLHVIKGKAVMSSDLQVAIVKRHRDCEFFRLVESTDAVATYETQRKGEPATKMSFTIEQARQAQLGGDNWKKYPAAMLRARCSAALARAVYPDLMLGTYEEDEARSFAPEVKPERDITPASQVVGAKPEPTKAADKLKADLRAQVEKTVGGKLEAKTVSTPLQRIRFAWLKSGRPESEMSEYVKNITGKTDKKALDDNDVGLVENALKADASESGEPFSSETFVEGAA